MSFVPAKDGAIPALFLPRMPVCLDWLSLPCQFLTSSNPRPLRLILFFPVCRNPQTIYLASKNNPSLAITTRETRNNSNSTVIAVYDKHRSTSPQTFDGVTSLTSKVFTAYPKFSMVFASVQHFLRVVVAASAYMRQLTTTPR